MDLKKTKTVPVSILSHAPDIRIWYCRIRDIVNCIFKNFTYHNQQPMVNEIFQKDDFNFPIFNTNEIKTLNSFKALKKQIEWSCGRYLIKQMVKTRFSPDADLNRISVSVMEQGAPFISHLPDIAVSLSHSNDYTACAFSKGKVKDIGIDIERIRTKPDEHFLNIAFTKKERSGMMNTARQIYTNWTIKEAFLKYIKKGFNEPLHHVEILNGEIRHNGRQLNLDIKSWDIESSYILSLVCPAGHQS